MPDLDEVYVVVVDDDATSAEVLMRLLNKEGATCVRALDISDALDAIRTLPQVHVVFLDLDMGIGKADGYDALALLRSDPNSENAAFLAYTAHLSEMANARTIGFDGFIGKPLVTAEFHKQWLNILQGKPVWAVR